MNKKKLSLWLPPIIWALLIFIFSSFPTTTTLKIYWQDFILKKSAHMVEYGMLAILVYRAIKNSQGHKKNSRIFSILISSLYGVSDEIHQVFTPGREPKVRDVFFDTIGAVIAILFLWKLLPKAPKKLKILAEKLRLI